MAIAPIDLQTMYANMNNVARTVSNQQQGAQLAQQLHENQVIQQNSEKANSVHKAAENEAKSGMVNEDGHQQSGQQNQNNRKDKDNQNPAPKVNEIRESYLGQHINIER